MYMSIRTGLTAGEAVQLIQSGNRVFIHGSAATPVTLIKALQQRYAELDDVELVSITSMGDVDFNQRISTDISFLILYLFLPIRAMFVIVRTEIMCPCS
jgi:hypothetical protein